MNEKMHTLFWAIAAFVIFALATTAQIVYGPKTWPFDWLKFVPTLLGDVTAMVFWLGAGPLVLSFAFLVPIRPSFFAAKIATVLACLIAVINPIANLVINLERFGSMLQSKTFIINGLTMLGAAIPIFFFVVFVPQIIIKLLKKAIHRAEVFSGMYFTSKRAQHE